MKNKSRKSKQKKENSCNMQLKIKPAMIIQEMQKDKEFMT